MDRRLKIITITLSIVYVVIIGGYLYQDMADFIYGAKTGFNKGQAMAQTDEMHSISTAGAFFLSVKPEKGLRAFPTVILNQLDGKPMNAEIEKMVVEVSNVKEKRSAGMIVAADVCFVLLSFFAIFMMILIPVQVFRIIRSITGNKIFDPANIKKLRLIGYALLAFYTANLVINFIHCRIAASVLCIEGYSLRLDWGNITLVLLGLVVLLFAEVLKVSVRLKEEQDLTV
jgi:hypothetical protein